MNFSNIHIPGYRLHAEIGSGGMASVYLATQESLDRQVAIKILRHNSDLGVGERFINEARFIASLDSPHIITIYDISTLDNGGAYIAMEYIGGGDLSENRRNFSDTAPVLGLIRQLAQGLAAVHDSGIIHRDVKPGNILFRRDGTAVLTDFGIAKDVENDSDLTQAGSSLGSPAYSSPEQAQGLPLDVTTDIYSLGVVALELLLGHNPFKGDSHTGTAINHIQLPVPALPAALEDLSTLVQRMLAKCPEERYQSCRDLIAEIDRTLASTDGANETTQGSHALSPVTGRVENAKATLGRRGRAALAGLAICAALGAAYFGISYESEAARQINRLLAHAEQSMAAGRYLAPEGDNARDFYRQVLLLDSANQTAAAGMKAAVESQVDAYLASGERALASGRLQRPQENSAMHYFRQALTIDGDNERAQSGIAQVIVEYARLARADLRKRDYKRANYFIDSGLSIAPDNEALLAIRNELIQQQLALQLKQQRRQKTLQKPRKEPRRNPKGSTGRTFIHNMLDKLRGKITSDR